jgi:phosphoglycolate phosphatase
MSFAAVTIGFDLDMTLVDSRPVSERGLIRMDIEHGIDLDLDELMARYGLPISQWLPSHVDSTLFRRLQAEELSRARPMPGAKAAIDAARRVGARAIVVTAAPLAIADGMLEAAGLSIDQLHADAWAGGKAWPLRQEECVVFVGDHADDMLAARQAGALPIGVNTGTTPPIGAELILEDLRDFPGWLQRGPSPTSARIPRS